MSILGTIVALAIIVVIAVDTFEAIVFPRRVKHGYRFARAYYRFTWAVWRGMGRSVPVGWPRNGFFSTYGPLSLFGLISTWAIGLILGFALLHASLGTALAFPNSMDRGLLVYIYFSGTTFFTLGFGDIVPTGAVGRILSVAEAGIGFGFLAVVLSYLPVIYQTFSRREVTISLLDARAGSPPTAGELLRRLGPCGNVAHLQPLLLEWERWSAELLESHVSFPVLRFFRSQHDNQSWVAALTAILDAAAIFIANSNQVEGYQARLTFAMARHAAVDLGLVSQVPPLEPPQDRLPADELRRLVDSLQAARVPFVGAAQFGPALAELRALYEPFVYALAEHLELAMPPFLAAETTVDNWRTSPWMRSPELGRLPTARAANEHFH